MVINLPFCIRLKFQVFLWYFILVSILCKINRHQMFCVTFGTRFCTWIILGLTWQAEWIWFLIHYVFWAVVLALQWSLYCVYDSVSVYLKCCCQLVYIIKPLISVIDTVADITIFSGNPNCKIDTWDDCVRCQKKLQWMNEIEIFCPLNLCVCVS